MPIRYVYSLNGEDYTGNFPTRNAAEQAALAAADQSADPPASIFVARAVDNDPGAAGHARALLARIPRLRKTSPAQVAELDAAIASTVLAWMDKHHLRPDSLADSFASSFANSFHVEAISQRPVYPALHC